MRGTGRSSLKRICYIDAVLTLGSFGGSILVPGDIKSISLPCQQRDHISLAACLEAITFHLEIHRIRSSQPLFFVVRPVQGL